MGKQFDELHKKKVTDSIKFTVKEHVSVFMTNEEVAENALHFIAKLDPDYSELDTKGWYEPMRSGVSDKIILKKLQGYGQNAPKVPLYCTLKIMGRSKECVMILVTFHKCWRLRQIQ